MKAIIVCTIDLTAAAAKLELLDPTTREPIDLPDVEVEIQRDQTRAGVYALSDTIVVSTTPIEVTA